MTPGSPPTHHPHLHPFVVITLVEPNDILSRLPAAFIPHPDPPNIKRAGPANAENAVNFCQVRRREVSAVMKPLGQPFLPPCPPPSGDRCDCLTRSVGSGVPIKRLGRPSRGPSRPLTPLRATRFFLALSCIPARLSQRIATAPHYQDLGQRPSPRCGGCL